MAVILLTSAFGAAGQPQNKPMTPGEAPAAVETDMRGSSGEAPPGGPLGWSPLPGGPLSLPLPPRRELPGQGVISAATLRHTIPKKARQAFDRASEASQAGNYGIAARALEEAIAVDPDFAQAHANLGVQYLRLKRLPEAAAEMQRSLDLDPAAAPVHANLAVVLLNLGDMQGAEESARRSLAIASANDRARYVLGLALGGSAEGRPEAIEQLRLAARTIAGAQRALELLLGGEER